MVPHRSTALIIYIKIDQRRPYKNDGFSSYTKSYGKYFLVNNAKENKFQI